MATMNISLPESLKVFVDRKVASANYGTASEYVRELIRRDQDRACLRDALLQGGQAPVTGIADAEYFAELRASIRKPTKAVA